MKLSDYKGEDGIYLLADILEPATEIVSDAKIKEAVSAKASRLYIAKLLMKDHAKSIIEIFAAIEGEDPKTYKPNIIELTKNLLDLLNDEDMLDFFTSQAQMTGITSSGSATENIEGKER